MASNKSSQLLYKALNGDFLQVENLLLQGLSPNMVIHSGETIFTVVCTTICQLTLHPTEEINTEEYGIIKLKHQEDLLHVVELMLKYGAKYEAYDNHGDTCLHIAARSGVITFVEVLINSDDAAIYILNKAKENVLHAALMRDGPDPHDLVEYLIGKGACIHGASKHIKYTPLMVAVSYGHALSVGCLLQHGAKSAACDRDGNNSLIHAFTQDAYKGTKTLKSRKPPLDAVIDLLLLHTSPGELYLRNKDGESVLHFVAKCRYVHAKKLLDSSTIDVVNMPNREGNTPFDICFKSCVQKLDYGSVKIVYAFVEAGALLTMKNQYNVTPVRRFSAQLDFECGILMVLLVAGLNLSQLPKRNCRLLLRFLCKNNKLTYLVAKGFILYCEMNSYVQQSLVTVMLSEVVSLQDLTGRVIRLNLWPNAVHGVKYLQIPIQLKAVVVPEYSEI